MGSVVDFEVTYTSRLLAGRGCFQIVADQHILWV
jgi:hypothetical protein